MQVEISRRLLAQNCPFVFDGVSLSTLVELECTVDDKEDFQVLVIMVVEDLAGLQADQGALGEQRGHSFNAEFTKQWVKLLDLRQWHQNCRIGFNLVLCLGFIGFETRHVYLLGVVPGSLALLVNVLKLSLNILLELAITS